MRCRHVSVHSTYTVHVYMQLQSCTVDTYTVHITAVYTVQLSVDAGGAGGGVKVNIFRIESAIINTDR